MSCVGRACLSMKMVGRWAWPEADAQIMMGSMKAFFATASLICLVACVSGPPEPHRLTDRELTSLLSDVRILEIPPQEDWEEAFWANGEYQNWGRGTAQGRFAIANGRVCVTRPQLNAQLETSCRAVFRNPEGDLFFSSSDVFSPAVATRFRTDHVSR